MLEIVVVIALVCLMILTRRLAKQDKVLADLHDRLQMLEDQLEMRTWHASGASRPPGDMPQAAVGPAVPLSPMSPPIAPAQPAPMSPPAPAISADPPAPAVSTAPPGAPTPPMMEPPPVRTAAPPATAPPLPVRAPPPPIPALPPARRESAGLPAPAMAASAVPAAAAPSIAPPKPPAAKPDAGPRLPFEEQLGSRLFVWLGALAIALAGIFLVKYTVDRGFLTPPVRMALGVALGITCLVAGERLRAGASRVATVFRRPASPCCSPASWRRRTSITWSTRWWGSGSWPSPPPRRWPYHCGKGC